MWIGPPLWISPMWPQQVGFFWRLEIPKEIPKGYGKYQLNLKVNQCKSSISLISMDHFPQLRETSRGQFFKSRKPKVIVCKILSNCFPNLKYIVVAYLRSMNIYLPAMLMFILYKTGLTSPAGKPDRSMDCSCSKHDMFPCFCFIACYSFVYRKYHK